MYTRKAYGRPHDVIRDDQLDARGASWNAEGFVVLVKPGNAGRGKGPQFKTNART